MLPPAKSTCDAVTGITKIRSPKTQPLLSEEPPCTDAENPDDNYLF